MSLLSSRPALRWLAPVGAAVAVLGGGAAVGAITAAADRSLPERSAAQLLVDLQTARLEGMSGTIVYRADLGLPDLSALGAGEGPAGSDLTSLLSGTRTLRVWYAGPDQARVALLGTLGETDVIINGRDVWVWESRENKATHDTLPERSGGSPMPQPSELGMTPEALANAALALLDPSTEISTNRTASVAGRSAYELVLAPRDPASLIASVRLAIDAEEHVPLRVQIFDRGHESPALEAAFTQVSFERPDPSRFTFNPPPGTTIDESSDGPLAPPIKPNAGTNPDAGAKPDLPATPARATVGSGWGTVVVLRMPEGQNSPDGDDDGSLGRLLEQLPRVGNGTALTSRLFSVLLTDDGRILLGAVSAERLAEAADDPAAALPS